MFTKNRGATPLSIKKGRHDKKIKKTLDKISFIILFQIRVSSKIMLYITAIFVITGVFRFRPEILMQFFNMETFPDQDITLQAAWAVILPAVILVVDIIYEFLMNIRNGGLMNLLIMPVVAIIACFTVSATEFDGDRMLAVYLIWWIIKKLCCWLLCKINSEIIEIHRVGAEIETAVCLPNEDAMHDEPEIQS